MIDWFIVQVSKNSTVRKNDYNVVTGGKENDSIDFSGDLQRHERASSGTERCGAFNTLSLQDPTIASAVRNA